jgi:hypothetical protein
LVWLLYMATAVAAASAHRLEQVKVPENGQLAINPPLTHSQLGALSTRSVLPWTVDRMNRLINGIGGNVEVVNPLLAYWPMRSACANSAPVRTAGA